MVEAKFVLGHAKLAGKSSAMALSGGGRSVFPAPEGCLTYPNSSRHGADREGSRDHLGPLRTDFTDPVGGHATKG
jgi:hypothetical protein